MLGKAIWPHRIQENPSATPRTPLGELTALPQTPYLVGRAGCPSPRTPSPALGPSGLASPTPTPKLAPTPLTGESQRINCVFETVFPPSTRLDEISAIQFIHEGYISSIFIKLELSGFSILQLQLTKARSRDTDCQNTYPRHSRIV